MEIFKSLKLNDINYAIFLNLILSRLEYFFVIRIKPKIIKNIPDIEMKENLLSNMR